MNVIALRQEAVFMNAGSYVMSPGSSGSLVLIFLRSVPRMQPSATGRVYVWPVRVSLTSRVPWASLTAAPPFPLAPDFGTDVPVSVILLALYKWLWCVNLAYLHSSIYADYP